MASTCVRPRWKDSLTTLPVSTEPSGLEALIAGFWSARAIWSVCFPPPRSVKSAAPGQTSVCRSADGGSWSGFVFVTDFHCLIHDKSGFNKTDPFYSTVPLKNKGNNMSLSNLCSFTHIRSLCFTVPCFGTDVLPRFSCGHYCLWHHERGIFFKLSSF